jgi:hypothetical protein
MGWRLSCPKNSTFFGQKEEPKSDDDSSAAAPPAAPGASARSVSMVPTATVLTLCVLGPVNCIPVSRDLAP